MATVSGTVTVQPGRLLGADTVVLQDESGGIAVRLPAGADRAALARGSIVWAHGPLAAPYGNLEMRPADTAAVRVVGSGGLPSPAKMSTAGLRESNEGLLAEIDGIVTDVDGYASGAVSIRLRDSSGDGRVYAFAAIDLERNAVRRGTRVRAIGIIGQRASRAGADDGHRLWLRGTGDLEVVSGPPVGTTPPGGGSNDDRPKVPRVLIRDATPGRTVTIVGVVTSKAGLIDAERRRVTVQDRSGAILVRYPADVRPAGVGRKIRVTGEVGTWYDATQLEAGSAPRHKARAKVASATLTRPPAETDEWSLVTVKVLITGIERSGETWRAEAVLRSGQTLPIIGLAGSRIDGELLDPGREARISGIVRRAHPSATDQRFGIAPRSRKDVRLGARREGHDDDADDDSRDEDDDDDEAAAVGTEGHGGAALPSVTLGALARHDGRMVRVGGRVRAMQGRRLTLDDGTARGVVRLGDAVGPVVGAIDVGDVVNAIGRVRRRGDGRHEVLVMTSADLRGASQLVAAPSSPTTGARDEASAPATALIAASGLLQQPAGEPTTGPAVPLLVAAAVSLISGVLLLAVAGLFAWRVRHRPRPTVAA